jgi:uncharacterized OB-fold protein
MQRTLPPVTELTGPYWEGCRAGELRLQQCTGCGRYQFYPRILCSHCHGRELKWVAAEGHGTIASFTVVRRAISKAYTAPYVVALIDLAEGVRMMSSIVDVEPETVRVGDPVTVDFEAWSDELSLPVFRLAKIGGSQ